MFLENKNIIFKIIRSKVTDYAALNEKTFKIKKKVMITRENRTSNAKTETNKKVRRYLLGSYLYKNLS